MDGIVVRASLHAGYNGSFELMRRIIMWRIIPARVVVIHCAIALLGMIRTYRVCHVIRIDPL